MYRVNGSVFWKHDEHVTLDLFEDYSIGESAFACKLKSSLTSTIKNIPTLSAILNHSHNTSKVDSSLKLMVSTTCRLLKSPYNFFLLLHEEIREK